MTNKVFKKLPKSMPCVELIKGNELFHNSKGYCIIIVSGKRRGEIMLEGLSYKKAKKTIKEYKILIKKHGQILERNEVLEEINNE